MPMTITPIMAMNTTIMRKATHMARTRMATITAMPATTTYTV